MTFVAMSIVAMFQLSILVILVITMGAVIMKNYFNTPSEDSESSKKIKRSLNVSWIIKTTLVVISVMAILWALNNNPHKQGGSSVNNESTIEVFIEEEWVRLEDHIAPVGHYAYTDLPGNGRDFRYRPQGAVYAKVRGSNRIMKITPENSSGNIGRVFSEEIGYMSIEDKPVKVIRWVEKK